MNEDCVRAPVERRVRGMDKDDNRSALLFELHYKDGNVCRIYENGMATGFPDGTVLINHAASLLLSLRCLAREKLLPAPDVTGLKGKPCD